MAFTITWTGNSGLDYQSEAFPIGTQFNPVSAVYIACRKIPSGSFEALYVGEAQSLKDRLNSGLGNHDGLKRAQNYGATHIAVVQVSGNTERLRVETDLRHGLNPSANAQNALGGRFNG